MGPRRACGLCLVLVTAAACDRRVEEPLPTIRPLDPTSVEVQPPKLQPSKPKRCVRASPPAARRAIPKSPDPTCPKDPEGNQKVRRAKVSFPEGKDAAVAVEVVENDHDRQRGLMYRTKMPPEHGMLFVFGEKENHAFWMHNTCIPLDMLYIDDDGFIVGIEENTPTMSDDTFEVGCPSQYVLEVNAGWTRAHGVFAGQFVKIEGL